MYRTDGNRASIDKKAIEMHSMHWNSIWIDDTYINYERIGHFFVQTDLQNSNHFFRWLTINGVVSRLIGVVDVICVTSSLKSSLGITCISYTYFQPHAPDDSFSTFFSLFFFISNFPSARRVQAISLALAYFRLVIHTLYTWYINCIQPTFK